MASQASGDNIIINPEYHMATEGTHVALNNDTMSKRLGVKQAKSNIVPCLKICFYLCVCMCVYM